MKAYLPLLLLTILSVCLGQEYCPLGISSNIESEELEYATLGGGCFWCMEAVFNRIRGVKDVISGYAGGHVTDPTYKEVKAGTTGHAEVVQVRFDPTVISYEELLRKFFYAHDPTSVDQQEGDIGNQYRSVIFYHDSEQKDIASEMLDSIDSSGNFSKPIVTQVEPLANFCLAETYHQDYYDNNFEEEEYTSFIGNRLESLAKFTGTY